METKMEVTEARNKRPSVGMKKINTGKKTIKSENKGTKMEGIETGRNPQLGNGKNTTDTSKIQPMVTDKKKKKKKKNRGQKKAIGIMTQTKNAKPENANNKQDSVKNPTNKRKEIEDIVTEGNDTPQGKGQELETAQKPKKVKKRTNRTSTFNPEKMELTSSLHQETEGRTSHRDERTLYVRFPPSLSVREKSYVEPLVPTAVDIRFPRLSPGSFAKFCYIEFGTEEETSVMKDKIGKLEVNGETFYADYVGKKSKAYDEKGTRVIDPLKLYVGGLPKGVQAKDIKAIFPTASRVLYRKASNKFSQSHAFVMFATHEEALRVFNASRELKVQGKDVIVVFATHRSESAMETDAQPVTALTKIENDTKKL